MVTEADPAPQKGSLWAIISTQGTLDGPLLFPNPGSPQKISLGPPICTQSIPERVPDVPQPGHPREAPLGPPISTPSSPIEEMFPKGAHFHPGQPRKVP